MHTKTHFLRRECSVFLPLFFLGACGAEIQNPKRHVGIKDATEVEKPKTELGVAIVCGNGIKEHGEQCDGNDFGDRTCSDVLDFDFGVLQCDSNCHTDFMGCSVFDSCADADNQHWYSQGCFRECGDDVLDIPVCNNGVLECLDPAYSILGASCPKETCWGSSYPAEICIDGRWRCESPGINGCFGANTTECRSCATFEGPLTWDDTGCTCVCDDVNDRVVCSMPD